MKITMIGTSHGVPEVDGRRCSCALIEVEDRFYFIDMGTQAIEDLRVRHIPVEAVKGIFLTHMHGDHTNGLISFVDLCSWYFKEASPRIVIPEMIGVDVIKAWLMVNHNTLREDLEFQQTKEGLVYDDGVIAVTAYKTQHIEPSFAYLVEAENRRVLFTGDLKDPEIDFPIGAVQQHTHLVVAESAHFSHLKYLGILYQNEIDHLLITHYQPKMVPDVWKLKERVNVPVELATDGMEIRL